MRAFFESTRAPGGRGSGIDGFQEEKEAKSGIFGRGSDFVGRISEIRRTSPRKNRTRARVTWISRSESSARCRIYARKNRIWGAVFRGLCTFIQNAITDGGKYCYWIQRENHFKNMTVRHGTMRPDWVPRLMPREKVKVVGCVHEAVLSPFPKRKAKGRLIHYPYTSWDQVYVKLNQYSKLAARKLAEQNRPCGFFSHVVLHPICAFLSAEAFQGGALGISQNATHEMTRTKVFCDSF